MNLKRTATFGIVGGALAAWLAAAATSGTRDNTAPLIFESPAIDTRGAELASEIRRLHQRLHPDATPREPGRNLFAFSAPTHRTPRLTEASAAASTEVVPAAPAAPQLRLSGLAEDRGEDGSIVRTAIISSEGQLFLAKEGDAVTARYRIARISADVVELVDLLDNSTLRLVLK
jgi:hypothetical protein